MSAPRCPRCRRRNYDVTQWIEVEEIHEVRNGIVTNCVVSGAVGNATQTEAACIDCGHQWRLRRPHDWALDSAGKEGAK